MIFLFDLSVKYFPDFPFLNRMLFRVNVLLVIFEQIDWVLSNFKVSGNHVEQLHSGMVVKVVQLLGSDQQLLLVLGHCQCRNSSRLEDVAWNRDV